MKKIYIVTALTITLCSHAEIPTVELKNASAAMQPGYESLSPAYGALYWYSPFIRNIYSYGPDCKTKALIHELFSILHDGITFDCTHGFDSVVRYLTVKDIGALCRILEKNKEIFASYNLMLMIQDQERTTLLQNLQPQKKAALDIAIKKLEKKHKQQRDQQLSQSFSPIRKELEAYINKFLADQHARIEELFKKGLESTIKRYQDQSSNPNIQEKEKIQLTEKIKTLQTKQPPSSGSTLVTVLINSKLEEGNLFPKDTVKNILLAFAWKKAAARNDFIQFYEGYAGHTGLATATIITPENWNGAYTKQDYTELTAKDPKTFSLDDFIFAGKGYDIFINIWPPEVSMSGNAHFQGHSFPDCGETSLRNFFNLLLYTPEKTFDTSVLEKLNADEKLISFYKEYPDCTNIETDAAHDDWAAVVSAHDGVAYTSNTYEIDTRPTGQANMQKLIGTLIPGANSWKNLQELLKNKCDIEFSFEEKQAKEVITLSFSLKKLDEYAIENFEWIFTPDHFKLSIPSKSARNKNYIKFLNSNPTENTFALLGLFTNKIEDFTLQSDSKSYIPLFFVPMKEPEERIGILEKLNTYKGNETTKHETIKSIFLSLPDDEYFINLAIKKLNLSDAAAQYEFLSKTLGGKCQSFFNSTLTYNAILEGNKHLYSWTADNIKNIKDEKLVANTIEALIQNKDDLLILQPFYTWATDNIKNIKDEMWIMYTIKALIQKQITNKDDLLILKPFYSWAAENIETIKNEILIKFIITALIRKQINTEDELILLQPFYSWATQNIENIKRDLLIVDIIKALIQKQINTKETAQSLKPLYEEMLKTKLAPESRSELQAKLKEIDAITKTVQ